MPPTRIDHRTHPNPRPPDYYRILYVFVLLSIIIAGSVGEYAVTPILPFPDVLPAGRCRGYAGHGMKPIVKTRYFFS